MAEQPQDPDPAVPNAEEKQMLNALAKFGSVHPLGPTDIERLERLEAMGLVVKDPRNPTYSLTVRGWDFVRRPAESE